MPEVYVFKEKLGMGAAAARKGADLIRAALKARGKAAVILATGASQFEMMDSLVKENVDWSKVSLFHLDEYVGMPITHPASFRKYLKERFVDKVGRVAAFHFVNGDAANPQDECRRLGDLIRRESICAAFVGIGENAHLAFNDPPADFDTEEPFLVLELDAACRGQQLGEGWFKTLADVPRHAISMSIQQIMKAQAIIVTVPDARKARALKDSLEGSVSNQVPSSILQRHPACYVYTDEAGAGLFSKAYLLRRP